MASPALSKGATKINPAVSGRPRTVQRTQNSSPAARKSALRKLQQGMTKKTPQTNSQGMRMPTPGSAFRGSSPISSLNQSAPNEAARKSALRASKNARTPEKGEIISGTRDKSEQEKAYERSAQMGGIGSGSTRDKSEQEKAFDRSAQMGGIGSGSVNDKSRQENAADLSAQMGGVGSSTGSTDTMLGNKSKDEEEEEANEAESRSTLQSDQLRARTQETAQQQANVQTQKAEPRKRIVKEAAVYAFGFIIDTINITTAGGGLIGTILPKAVILGHDGLRMFFGGKIEGIEPLSWDPLPFSLVDPNANFKMAWTIIKFIILIVLTICTMTLIGIVGYGFAHPLEAVQTFGPAFAQIFVR